MANNLRTKQKIQAPGKPLIVLQDHRLQIVWIFNGPIQNKFASFIKVSSNINGQMTLGSNHGHQPVISFLLQPYFIIKGYWVSHRYFDQFVSIDTWWHFQYSKIIFHHFPYLIIDSSLRKWSFTWSRGIAGMRRYQLST